jgi:SWIM zinc finger
MILTSEQVLAQAPDSSSASAGKKLASAKQWRNLGRNEEALWGECQGSALYQVRVDLSTLSVKCSCPSHKFPCKHGLGLMLLAAATPDTLAEGQPPQWVADWLSKRHATAEAHQAAVAAKPPEVVAAEKAKRADKRMSQVTKGIEQLDLWLNDLMRNGLASVETQPSTFWENQAARMVDAKAPGIAGRLRRMAGIPGATRDWPARLLDELGRLALLTHAFSRLDSLDPSLQEDVRELVGWTLDKDEVAQHGTRVIDEWAVLGQRVDDEGHVRTQRTWMRGVTSGQSALVLQFAVNSQPFGELIICGIRMRAELIFWPSASPIRARIDTHEGTPQALAGTLSGAQPITAALAGVAASLAKQPWQDRFLCMLGPVTPLRQGDDDDEQWLIRDEEGASLQLMGDDHWKLLAVSGGQPVELAGEWDGYTLRPLGVMAEGRYHVLGGEA